MHLWPARLAPLMRGTANNCTSSLLTRQLRGFVHLFFGFLWGGFEINMHNSVARSTEHVHAFDWTGTWIRPWVKGKPLSGDLFWISRRRNGKTCCLCQTSQHRLVELIGCRFGLHQQGWVVFVGRLASHSFKDSLMTRSYIPMTLIGSGLFNVESFDRILTPELDPR